MIIVTIIANGLCQNSTDISDRVCRAIPTAPKPRTTFTVVNPNKTLSIIFGAAGTMMGDLSGLQMAAKKIVEKFRIMPANPITDYVLTWFSDTNERGTELLQTRDPDLFLRAVNDILPIESSGCADLTLEAIINALRVSQENSFAYAFIDSDALDFFRIHEVLEIITDKQITVNFLKSGACFESDSQGERIYKQIADFSGGVVFDMVRSEIDDVLLVLTEQMDRDYAPIENLGFFKDEERLTPLFVDSSFRSVTITIKGEKPTLKVSWENGTVVSTTMLFSRDNVRIITFQTTGGSYNMRTNAKSDYSVVVGGASELKFNFGFSPNLPRSMNETVLKPAWDAKNFMSIFVSNPNLIKCIFKTTLIPLEFEHELLFDAFDLNITRKNGNIFTVDRFTMPREGFKVRLWGYDKNGREFQRLIPTGIIENTSKYSYDNK